MPLSRYSEIFQNRFAFFESMVKKIRVLPIALLMLSCNTPVPKAEAVKFAYLQSLMNSDNDTTYVINFWATWCKPCVKELPELIKFENENKNEKVKLILVSLDFKRDMDSLLNKFISNKKISSTVVLLDEPDYDSWIDKISSEWGGAIPATLVLNNKKNLRKFHEGELNYEELNQLAFN